MSNDLPSWFRVRRYLHFDAPIKYETAEKLVTNPKRVATHSFFPLIRYQIESYKVFCNSAGKIERKPKSRPISYAAHLDSHIYAYYSKELSKLYEEILLKENIDKNILAFRSLSKSNIDYANDVFEEVKRRANCVVVGLDISGFFDNLNHQILKTKWAKILDKDSLPEDHFAIFRSLTKYSYIKRDEIYKKLGISPNNPKKGRNKICEVREFRKLRHENNRLISVHRKNEGIPQGTPISALLSNIYMIDFDIEIKKYIDKINGKYYRYCDDMLFIVNSKFENSILKFAREEITKHCLNINDEKTEIIRFYTENSIQKCNKPLQYLGFTFDGQRKLIRSAALSRFSNRMKSSVALAKKTRKKVENINDKRGLPTKDLFKRNLYERYSYIGRRNFISYGYRASKIMDSEAIRRQLKPLWSRLQKEINNK